MDSENYIIRPSTETNIEATAGDVKDKVYRQAVTAFEWVVWSFPEAEKFIVRTLNELPKL